MRILYMNALKGAYCKEVIKDAHYNQNKVCAAVYVGKGGYNQVISSMKFVRTKHFLAPK